MVKPLQGIEPRSTDYKSVALPLSYRGRNHPTRGGGPRMLSGELFLTVEIQKRKQLRFPILTFYDRGFLD